MSVTPPDKNTGQTPANNPDQYKASQKEELTSKIAVQAHQISSDSASAASSSSISKHSIQLINNPQVSTIFIEERVKEIVREFIDKRGIEAEVSLLEAQMEEILGKSKDIKGIKILHRAKEKEVRNKVQLIESLQTKLIKDLNDFLDHKDVFSCLPVQFSRSLPLPEGEEKEQIQFLEDISINKLRNTSQYLKKVEGILEKNKEMILNQFCGNPNVNPNLVRFSLNILGDETHLRGQVTVKVTLCIEDVPIGYVVYKPRSAETEIEILKLFINLNRADPSNIANFFIYNIMSLGSEGSIWEFVEGKHLSMEAVRHLEEIIGESSEEFILARANLIRLQTICQKIGVTDLHHENIILVNKVQWVPIDLEVIKPGHATGLYGKGTEPDPLILTVRETELIEKFNKEQFTRLARTVPLPTCDFSNAGKSFNGAKIITESLNQILTDEGGILTISNSDLEGLIERDIQNGDIPLFSEKEGILYYNGDQRQEIARQKGRKNELNK